jgi:hypothetical protein
MEDSKSGMTWIGVLFVILVIWAIFGGGFGNGWGNHQAQTTTPVVLGGEGFGGWFGGGCNRVSNCEIERREIIDSATTQYQIEQQGAQTRAEVAAVGKSIEDQNNRMYIQGVQAELFDAKAKINALESQIYSDAKFNALSAQLSECCCGFNRRLDGIESQMLTKPALSGVAATNAGQIIPANFGWGWGWNYGNGNF